MFYINKKFAPSIRIGHILEESIIEDEAQEAKFLHISRENPPHM